MEEMSRRFDFHASSRENNAELHSTVRNELWGVAHTFNDLLPDSREKSLAITKLEESMFWANAAIARPNPN